MYTTKHSDFILLNSHPSILSCFSFQNFKLDHVLFCQGPYLPHERPSHGLVLVVPTLTFCLCLCPLGARSLLPSLTPACLFITIRLYSSKQLKLFRNLSPRKWTDWECSRTSDTLDPILPRRPQQSCVDCDLNDRNLTSPSSGG